MQPITITTIVNVIGALSQKTLAGNIFMVDSCLKSQGKGSSNLVTSCSPGQQIDWLVYSLDVQTPVLIDGITFLSQNPVTTEQMTAIRKTGVSTEHGGMPQWYYWSGIVPCSLTPGDYPYRFRLQMGKGANSVMYTDTPMLHVISPKAEDEIL